MVVDFSLLRDLAVGLLTFMVFLRLTLESLSTWSACEVSSPNFLFGSRGALGLGHTQRICRLTKQGEQQGNLLLIV